MWGAGLSNTPQQLRIQAKVDGIVYAYSNVLGGGWQLDSAASVVVFIWSRVSFWSTPNRRIHPVCARERACNIRGSKNGFCQTDMEVTFPVALVLTMWFT